MISELLLSVSKITFRKGCPAGTQSRHMARVALNLCRTRPLVSLSRFPGPEAIHSPCNSHLDGELLHAWLGKSGCFRACIRDEAA